MGRLMFSALREIEKPTPGDNEVLLKVSAASLHAGDYFLTTGIPYIMRLGLGLRKPRKAIPGFDVAGTVEAVGSKVTEFAMGDDGIWRVEWILRRVCSGISGQADEEAGEPATWNTQQRLRSPAVPPCEESEMPDSGPRRATRF